MNKIKKNFCVSLKKWKDTSFEGSVTDLAQMLRVSQGYLSNVLAGRRCGDEEWRRFVANKIGIPYQEMIGISENSSEITPEKEANAPIPMDPAIQILREALEETGVKINEKQKKAVVAILREELKKSEVESKAGIKKFLEAFGK